MSDRSDRAAFEAILSDLSHMASRLQLIADGAHQTSDLGPCDICDELTAGCDVTAGNLRLCVANVRCLLAADRN